MSKLTSYTFVSFFANSFTIFFQPASNDVFTNDASSTGLILGKSLMEFIFQNGF